MYENSGGSREGPSFILGKEKQRKCVNGASKSLSVHTYVPSPGKESTFQWGQIQIPKHLLIFICFHLQLTFHDLYNVFCFVKVELQYSKKSSNINFC